MAARPQRKKATGTVEQWASRVISFSSQYDSTEWPASAAIGPPRVYPRYGDFRGAWAQGVMDDEQYIELEYDTDVFVSAINIYETLNCGGVKRVSVQSPRGTWDTVWEADKVQLITTSRIFTPNITIPSYRTKAVRLDVDCTLSPSWVEIDAVQLVGRRLRVDSPPCLSSLSNDLAKLVNDRDSSDVVFRVQGTDIYAHRAILCVRSQKLKEMLTGVSQDSTITIDDIDHRAFLGVLHYIYSSNIPVEIGTTSLVDVWRAAKKFDIDGLRAYCVKVIDDRLDTDNVVSVFAKASDTEPVSEDIREVCLEYMASNLASVSLTPEFKAVSHNLMLEIVQLCTARMPLK